MNCSACGADNREGARFCRTCGASLHRDKEQASPEGEKLVSSAAAAPAKATPGADQAEMVVDEPGLVQGEEKEPVVDSTIKTEQAASPAGPDSGVPIEAEPEAVIAAGTDEVVAEPALDEQPGEAPAEFEMAAGDEDAEYEPLPEPEDDVFSFWRDQAELMTPLEPGTVIIDRFAVIEALDVQEDEILYLAHDLQRCWQCGYDANDPEGAFCARCGVLMDRRPEVRLLEYRDTGTEPSTDKVVLARLSHETRKFLMLAEPEPEPELESLPEPQAIRLLVGQRSDPGQVRELDEDSLFVLTMAPTYESRTGPVLGLFAVADGMGGHASGEVASRMALQVLVERVMQSIILPEMAGELILEDEVLALLRQATIAANDAVYLARQKRDSDMGTTLTTAMIRDNRLFVAHVGDCRAYRFNADGLEQLTTDHSVVANMVSNGQIEPDEIYTHPHRGIVYRCIGDRPVVEVDTNMLPLVPGDRVILCCDGLWEMIRNEGIEDVLMQEADAQAACDLLVQRANAAGGEDNISVTIIQVEAVAGVEED